MNSVLVLIDYYLPGENAGGPVWTIHNMVGAVSDSLKISVLTRNHDLNGKSSYECTHDEWLSYDNHSRFYASSLVQVIKQVLFFKSEFVYLNSYFSSKYSIIPLLFAKIFTRKKIILAPRGEFNSSALEIKPIRKSLYLTIFNLLRIGRGVLWQASSLQEKNDIQKNISGRKIKIKVVADLIPAYKSIDRKGVLEKPLKLIFLSRITPMKNLLGAIRSLSDLKESIQFSVYGPCSKADQGYLKECQQATEALPSNIQVTFNGAVEHKKVRHTLSENHLFILPTKGENFGHAIIEALSSGLPVIIGKNTKWSENVIGKLGWVVNSDKEVTEAIKSYVKLSRNERDALSSKAFLFVEDYYQNANLQQAKNYIKLFS